MIPSTLLYSGALVTLLGLAALVLPRRLLRRRARPSKAALSAVAIGVGLLTLGVAMPASERVVTRPINRLDAVLPRYLFHERHSIQVAAAPRDVDRAVRAVTADEIRFYRTLTWIRRLGRRGPESIIDPPSGVPILTVATRTGFQLLADEPGKEIVIGVAAPVSSSALAAARGTAPRPFIESAGGYVSIAMNFSIAADGQGGSLLSTETRVFAPDAETRRVFATYWRVIYPGSALIRLGWLDAIRRRAESAGRRAP